MQYCRLNIYCEQYQSVVTFESLAQTGLTSTLYIASSCKLETDDDALP